MDFSVTLWPSLVHTPCCTTPNSPTPSSLLIVMLSAGIMCLLGVPGARFSGASVSSSDVRSSDNAPSHPECSSFLPGPNSLLMRDR